MSSWLPRLKFLRTRTTANSSSLYTALPSTLSHDEGDFDHGDIIVMEDMELKANPGQGNALGLKDMYIDPDGIEPTEEEKRTLRRVSDTIPVVAFSIVIVELCERFAFYGLSGPFQNYLQNPLPEGGNGAGAPRTPGSPEPAGALGLGQTAATSLNNMFSVSIQVFPASYFAHGLTCVVLVSMFHLPYIRSNSRRCAVGPIQGYHILVLRVLHRSAGNHRSSYTSFTRVWNWFLWVASRDYSCRCWDWGH